MPRDTNVASPRPLRGAAPPPEHGEPRSGVTAALTRASQLPVPLGPSFSLSLPASRAAPLRVIFSRSFHYINSPNSMAVTATLN